MRDPNFVIHSYAATCVERLLTVKDNQVLRYALLLSIFVFVLLFGPSLHFLLFFFRSSFFSSLYFYFSDVTISIGQINEFVGPMLANLFEALSYKDSQENEYTMRGMFSQKTTEREERRRGEGGHKSAGVRY